MQFYAFKGMLKGCDKAVAMDGQTFQKIYLVTIT